MELTQVFLKLRWLFLFHFYFNLNFELETEKTETFTIFSINSTIKLTLNYDDFQHDETNQLVDDKRSSAPDDQWIR